MFPPTPLLSPSHITCPPWFNSVVLSPAKALGSCDEGWPRRQAVSLCGIVTPVCRITSSSSTFLDRLFGVFFFFRRAETRQCSKSLVKTQALKTQWISMWTWKDMRRLSGREQWMDKTDIRNDRHINNRSLLHGQIISDSVNVLAAGFIVWCYWTVNAFKVETISQLIT